MAIYSSGASFHSIISIFSPPISLITAETLVPLWPTIEPMGSTPSAKETTAILEREPGSLATDFTTTVPAETSGTSSSKSLEISLG